MGVKTEGQRELTQKNPQSSLHLLKTNSTAVSVTKRKKAQPKSVELRSVKVQCWQHFEPQHHFVV